MQNINPVSKYADQNTTNNYNNHVNGRFAKA